MSKRNDLTRIGDCVESKIKLIKLVGMMFMGQKTYGLKPEDLATRAEFFELMLADYEIKEVQEAFLVYSRQNNDIPTPSDIIKIIENPPEINYNQVSCNCGKHFGINTFTAEKRALVYAWHRGKGVNFTADKQQWLESYEAVHGKQEPNI